MQNILPQLVLWLPLLGFLFCAASGLVIKDPKVQKKAVSLIAPGVVLLAFVFALAVLFQTHARTLVPLIPGTPLLEPWFTRYGGLRVDFNLVLDPLSLLMALIITGVGGLIHVYAAGYMAEDKEVSRFFTYFNLFVFMMLLLVLGDNFLLMFVGWEGVGTCSYLLISFWFTDEANAKAGNKAFIVNRVGDLGFALGMMAVWSVFGTLSFFTRDGRGVMDLAAHARVLDLAGNPVPAGMITLICLLLLVGALGKSAQIPLFVWLPDAMAGPTPVSALIHAATMVTAGVVMLTRCSWLYVHSVTALQTVAWVGAITALLGALMALTQTDIKKVLAYSTISQLGYMFLACGVGDFSDGMFHVVTHAFFKGLLFLGAGAVIHSMLGQQDMRRMGGLKKLLPATWGVMIVATYSIAGFPLLSGFWSKDAILESASRACFGGGPVLYLIGLVTAFITAFYMNRLMWKTFYTDARFVNGQLPELHHSNEEHEHHEEAAHGKVTNAPASMMQPLYILALLALGFGWFAGPYGPAGGNLLKNFLAPSVAPLSLAGLQPQPELFPKLAGYLISSLAALGGLGLAAWLYRQHMATGELTTDAVKDSSVFNRLLRSNFGFDAVYNMVFFRAGGMLADRVLWHGLEEDVLNGTATGAAALIGRLSLAARKMQTGNARNYALVMLAGMVTLVLGLLVRVMQH